MSRILRLLARPVLFLFVCGLAPVVHAVEHDMLVEGFRNPPAAARPRVWWAWVDGNVTEQGVELDLAWLKRIGVGGVQNFDVAFERESVFHTPVVVDRPLIYLTPEWRKAFRYSVNLADQAGLDFAVAASPGWSETGGPWVQPQDAMKKLVWSETIVRGGVPFNGRLARPPDVPGLFQSIPLAKSDEFPVRQDELPYPYTDIAILAYRTAPEEIADANQTPTVTSSAVGLDPTRLVDGDLAHTVPLSYGEAGQAWVRLSFPTPQRIQSATVVIGRPNIWQGALQGWIEASDDGRAFRRISDLSRDGVLQSSALQQTVSFQPVRAREFRVVFARPVEGSAARSASPEAQDLIQVAEVRMHRASRVNRFEDKAGFSTRQILTDDDTPMVAQGDALRREDIVDLTNRMRSDGSLEWTPPKGGWTVLRFGYSLTGSTNRPASRTGTGLEVDKLCHQCVNRYLKSYLGEYEKALGPSLMGERGLRSLLTDSYEAGIQNWTADMLDQFKRRRGYDAVVWLPVLAGRVVESGSASDRFLWDFRRTGADLIAEAHYGQISALLRQRGMGRYGESHEVSRTFIGDGMEVKKTADVPMGAMWSVPLPGYPAGSAEADIRESASVAHIYGQNVTGAESFTAFGYGDGVYAYGFAPQHLKPVADRMMALGVNLFAISSPHQPDDRKGPGIAVGPFGQWFTRKETWAEQAGSWISYLARSSYLLQQGRFVADIAYLYGEDTNITSLFGTKGPSIPEGFGFDFINPDALINELATRNGRLVTRSGMDYRVLALDESTRRMSVPVLRKIRDLVRAGAAIVGPRPTQTPSLADDESEFRAIVAELWGSTSGERTVGEGKVFAQQSLDEALRSMRIPADVQFSKPAEAALRYVHRALGKDQDLYFISSSNTHPMALEASFRVSGRRPELWRADTGMVASLSYRMENGRTVVPLRLDPGDAVFVVFRQATAASSAVVQEPSHEVLATFGGNWNLYFPPNFGGPGQARFEKLHSWTESADAGIRYFSGTATYSRTFRIHGDWLAGRSRAQIDLGEVKNLAEVIVNGRSLGVLWKAPFSIDITDALKSGDNRIEIKVTNLWPNRMIGDKQSGARKTAFATFDPYKADSPLLESGLLGPVRLLAVKQNDRPEAAEPTTDGAKERAKLPLYRVIPAARPSELTRALADPVNHDTWARSNADTANTRYSALSQINRENVSRLEIAWIYRSGDGKSNVQANPVIVDGVMYAPTAGKNIVAIDARTGKEIWRFRPQSSAILGYYFDPAQTKFVYAGSQDAAARGLTEIGYGPAQRGMTYWPGDGRHGPRLFFMANGYLFCLDAKTGVRVDTFADQGKVAASKGPGKSSFLGAVAPAIYRNIIVAPNQNIVEAFDIVSGRRLWQFNTLQYPVARPDDDNGGNVWGGIAMDTARGIAYLATGDPHPNFVGIDRPGDNKHTNSVLALDARTGRLLWSFQDIAHNLWDIDIAAPPNLVTVTREGRRVDAVAQVTKLGNTLLLDRLTGKPLFPYRLRRAPASTIPGERTSPYQPDVQWPQPFARQVFSLADLTDISPQARDSVLRQLKNAHFSWFEPPHADDPTVFYGVHGGAEWTGASFDPTTGWLYVSSNELAWIESLARVPRETPYRSHEMQSPGERVFQQSCAACHGETRQGKGMAPALIDLGRRFSEADVKDIVGKGRNAMPPIPIVGDDLRNLIAFLFENNAVGQAASAAANSGEVFYQASNFKKLLDHQGYPGTKPPWGTLNAIDLNTGKLTWQVPLGEYEELTRNGVPKTGTENFGGAMVTAGGLVFCAGTRDLKIRAFDKTTGQELWQSRLPFGGYASPATYEVNGRQFVVIAASGGGKLGGEAGDAYVAFALPP